MKFLKAMNTRPGRAVRIVVGAVVMAAGIRAGGTGGWALAAFGVLPLATGALGVCPITPLLGGTARCGTACGSRSDATTAQKESAGV